ncbi:MAG TPA: ABC transporter substrate-binding protein [Falsiroseomonas sp.]|jgi:putative spermidine/putrescine transport system substrate-binding protein|nr:ABC transporter substrate-binding protein [Falsiroseomonas sp.]
MRRALLSAVAAFGAAIGFSLPAFAQAPAAQGGQLTLQAYAGIFRDNYTQVVVQPFTARTGTEVQYFDGGTSAQMLGRLRAQRADPQIDVVIMDVTTAQIACAEGLVEKIDASVLPVIGELGEMAREAGGGCGPAVTYDHLVMVYDTQAVQPAPTRWMAMADQAQRGRVALSAPPNIQGLALTAILANAATGDWRNIGAAMPRLREIAPNVQTFSPNPDGYTLILNGEVRFATGWNARAQLYSDQSQGRIGVVLPEEGTAFQINMINLVAGSKNRAQALSFMSHALSAEAQKAFTERMFYGPTNPNAQVAPAALRRTALAPEYRQQLVGVDWAEMVRLREQWNQRWRREVIAASNR